MQSYTQVVSRCNNKVPIFLRYVSSKEYKHCLIYIDTGTDQILLARTWVLPHYRAAAVVLKSIAFTTTLLLTIKYNPADVYTNRWISLLTFPLQKVNIT